MQNSLVAFQVAFCLANLLSELRALEDYRFGLSSPVSEIRQLFTRQLCRFSGCILF